MEKRHRNRAMRNLKSVGKTTANITGEAADVLFRWLTTDHSGMGKALGEMPKMGFFSNIKYALVYFLIGLIGVILQVAMIFFLIGYVIPFLLFGRF